MIAAKWSTGLNPWNTGILERSSQYRLVILNLKYEFSLVKACVPSPMSSDNLIIKHSPAKP